MKILIIEDEPAIRFTLRELLELNGHDVLAAQDGPEGVALARHRPDLILCDVGLPGLDGFQVCTAIQQLPECASVPFIFLTARSDRDDQRRGMALGADDYITKPFSERDILDAIAARVRRQRPLRERIEQLLAERQREAGADWSHELMTPLNGVLGGLELIEAEADAISRTELKELLGLVRAGAERQRVLSRKLVLHFELERLKSAPPPAVPPACAAAAAIQAGAAQAARELGRVRDLAVGCDPGTVPLAEAHLTAAIAELAGNAFSFSRPGQSVVITGTIVVDRYRITITDQGPGMTEEQRTTVAPFRQFGRHRQNQQGLGLGLAIVRSVAEIYGGTLRLEAGDGGRGLIATLDLPRQ